MSFERETGRKTLAEIKSVRKLHDNLTHERQSLTTSKPAHISSITLEATNSRASLAAPRNAKPDGANRLTGLFPSRTGYSRG
jgi:hypothetical protein